MFDTKGKLYKIIGIAFIVIAIIATIFYCRSEATVSPEYLEKVASYPNLYSLEDIESSNLQYPVAKGIVISTFAIAIGTLICSVGDVIDSMDSRKQEDKSSDNPYL